MTRRQPTLTSILLRNVSGAALTVGIAMASCTKADTDSAALGFLARLGLWLKLVLGFGSGNCEVRAISEPDYIPSRAQIRAHAHWLKCRASARKHPAHDLEMLMSFAPGCRRGLTLNQYRERLTRISVLGRAKIYRQFMTHRTRLYRILRVRITLRSSMNIGCKALCRAPLWPD